MGVYFPGVNVPETCFRCPAKEWYDFGKDPHGYMCGVLHDGKIISNVEARTSRRTDCPAVQVDANGRLIEADALYDACALDTSIEVMASAKIINAYMQLKIDDAPTIISGKEKKV